MHALHQQIFYLTECASVLALTVCTCRWLKSKKNSLLTVIPSENGKEKAALG